MIKISVVIPVYKNKVMFLDNLKVNYPYLKNCEIIVVDDASEENICQSVVEKYPNIRCIENAVNKGFGNTVNNGVEQAHGDIVILLNTDVVLYEDIVDKVKKHFEGNDKIFGISFAQVSSNMQKKGSDIVGKNMMMFVEGMPQHSAASDMKLGDTAWAEGGSAAFHRGKFIDLGGFRDVYAPFYWEDIDLSFRAHKNGLTVLFTPDICVQHIHESTIGKYFSPAYVKKIAYRNQLVFTWTNLSPSYLFRHCMYLPAHIIRAIKEGEWEFLSGLLAAILNFGHVKKTRSANAKTWALSDTEVFKKFARIQSI